MSMLPHHDTMITWRSFFQVINLIGLTARIETESPIIFLPPLLVATQWVLCDELLHQIESRGTLILAMDLWENHRLVEEEDVDFRSEEREVEIVNKIHKCKQE